MSETPVKELLQIALYDIETLDDEIRADTRCGELLRHFFNDQCSRKGLAPQQAATLAYGADAFLRDFLIGDLRENCLRPVPGRVRQFCGHWYIVRNIEPNMKELGSFISGILPFYEFCHLHGIIDETTLEFIKDETSRHEEYALRIESFHAIEGDGYDQWRNACPLP